MSQHIPDELLTFMADKFRMLSDPTRLMILRTLMTNGEQNVGQVVEATGSTQANISKHLNPNYSSTASRGGLAEPKFRICSSD